MSERPSANASNRMHEAAAANNVRRWAPVTSHLEYEDAISAGEDEAKRAGQDYVREHGDRSDKN